VGRIPATLHSAFKPIALWRALMNSAEGDWFVWADASRYFQDNDFGASIHSVIDALDGVAFLTPPLTPRGPCNGTLSATPGARRRVESAFGLDYDQFTFPESVPPTKEHVFGNAHRAYMTDQPTAQNTWAAFADLRPPPPSRLTSLLSTNMFIRNTPQGRLTVWDWLMIAVHRPDGFCSEIFGQDQTALALRLGTNRSLPAVRICACNINANFTTTEACSQQTKELKFVYSSLAHVENISLQSVYDTTKCTRDGDNTHRGGADVPTPVGLTTASRPSIRRVP
jgi:hypothetical protein